MEPNPDRSPSILPQVRFQEIPLDLNDDKLFTVVDQNGERVGRISLIYEPRKSTFEIGSVSVVPTRRNEGYGKSIHLAAGAMNVHEGQLYKFVSSGELSQGSIGVWESLVRDGLAIRVGEFKYEMIDQVKPEV